MDMPSNKKRALMGLVIVASSFVLAGCPPPVIDRGDLDSALPTVKVKPTPPISTFNPFFWARISDYAERLYGAPDASASALRSICFAPERRKV